MIMVSLYNNTSFVIVDGVKQMLGIASSDSESEQSEQSASEPSEKSESDVEMVAIKNRKIVRVVRQANTQPAMKTRAATQPAVKVEVKQESLESSLIGRKR